MPNLHYVFYALAACYGLLSLFAATSQLKALRGQEQAAKDAPVLMILGGVALALSFSGWWGVVTALVGCVLVSTAAVLNGKRGGQFHLSHHIMRGILGAAIVLGLALSLR